MDVRRIALVVLLICVADARAQPVAANSKLDPVFKAVLAFREGRLVVDASRSELVLGKRASAYQDCGLTPDGIKSELVAYLDGVLHGMGPALERVAIPPGTTERPSVEPRFRELARTDPETRELLALTTADWQEGRRRLDRWWERHGATQPPVATGEVSALELYTAAEFDAAFAEGPLLPLRKDRSEGGDDALLRRGEIVYRLAPPFAGDEIRLRPALNIHQWDNLRGAVAEEALAPLRCKLWYRKPVIDRVQDYLEVRGLSVQPYRTKRDAADNVALFEPPPQPAPLNQAGIAPERPRFADDGGLGGRVLLLPDPLIRTVFVETGTRGAAALWPALYLVLPSTDLQSVRAAPGRYLCRTNAVWKKSPPARTPDAVRLDLDTEAGGALEFAKLYLTPGELGTRMQRLAAIGYKAGINFTETVEAKRLRWTRLILEPVAAPEAQRVQPLDPSIPDCADAPPEPPEAPSVPSASTPEPPAATTSASTASTTSASDEKAPREPLPDARAADHVTGKPSSREARDDKRNNEIVISAEKPSGKPVALGLLYSHQGLQPADRFSIGFGHQRRPTMDASYSSDFVAFRELGRRLQLSAQTYSTVRTEQPTADDERQDERRQGAGLRAVIDLWRDVASSFGQAELGLSRARTKPEGSDDWQPEVTTANITLVMVQDRRATSASPYAEFALTLGGGRSAGHTFGQAALEASYRRFVGAFDRIDLRLHGAAVGSAAPSSESIPFGGEDSVRGYRSDWALVKRAASLQAEYWLPVPWTPQSESLAQILRRNLALAGFVDVAAISPADPATRRWYGGAGFGLRYMQGAGATRLTFRLDVARPVRLQGDLSDDERRTRINFTVSTQRTL